MELAFHEETQTYLAEKRFDLLYQEQTAEMTLPETMPDINRVVDSFGTVLVQSKTADGGSVTVTGGIQAGVLYLPEGGDQLQRIDVYLPFTVTKKLQTEPDTTLFYWGWIKGMDTRFINARKILVRATLGSELTLLTPTSLSLSRLENRPAGLECRSGTYPMVLPLCAAEKELQIADEVLMPEQEPGMDRLLKYTCGVEIEEGRSIGDKAVFKGNLVIRVMYQSENGTVSTWSSRVPFSQYAELSREVEEGRVSVQPIFRHVEIDTDGQPDSHRLLLNVTVTAQVLVRGTVKLQLTEDAYALWGDFQPRWQTLELTPCLDQVRADLTQTVSLPEDAASLLDCTLFADRPGTGAMGNRQQAELSGTILYFDADRVLRSKPLRLTLPEPPEVETLPETVCRIVSEGEIQFLGRQLRIPLTAELTCLKRMVCRNLEGAVLEEGETPEGPSLIVKTCSGSLWELAKEHHSTVSALRGANGLETDEIPEPRLLLIPTGQAVAAGEEVAE